MKFKVLIVLTALMAIVVQTGFAVASDKGKDIFSQKCASCHAVAPETKLPMKDKLALKGQPLWFAGSKFHKEWLQAWLAKPTPLLSVKWGTVEKGTNNHIALSPAEAGDVTAYLMGLSDKGIETDKTPPFPKAKADQRRFLAKAAQLFEKHQGCFACHKYTNRRGIELGGFTGPTLSEAGKRLQVDWVYAFLKEPRKYYPNGKCPIPGDKAFNKYTDENRAMLATYIVNIGAK